MNSPIRTRMPRRIGTVAAYRRQARVAPATDSSGRPAVQAGDRHTTMTIITPTNEMALIRKTPQRAGDGDDQAAEGGTDGSADVERRHTPRAIAWGMSSFGTRSGWIACQAGPLTAVPSPTRTSTRAGGRA